MQRIVIVGGGFAGLNAARQLRRNADVEIELVDRRNHHLFQPLLYQVAMAGLSPAEIAAPIRSLLGTQRNARVRQSRATGVDLAGRTLQTDSGVIDYDYLLLACGVRHAYFGNDEWEPHAPGLKSLEEALEIRSRVLRAYERAEVETDAARKRAYLTFVVIGGGPTGVELAGALGEMSRFTLASDFRNIDPTLARVILIEAGPRILPSFSEKQAARATRDLESLGVQVWASSPVTSVDAHGVNCGAERIESATTLWAAGVRAAKLQGLTDIEFDRQGRIHVGEDMSLAGHPEVFVIGDLAHSVGADGNPLPGMAPVAMQQGRFVARQISRDLRDEPRESFSYTDKGRLATIGRSKAIGVVGRFEFAGWFAWMAWLVVHIYYLVGFKNRLFVVIQWAWSYLRFNRGARLIVEREWKPDEPMPTTEEQEMQ
jgi:NADH dehydrogenase